MVLLRFLLFFGKRGAFGRPNMSVCQFTAHCSQLGGPICRAGPLLRTARLPHWGRCTGGESPPRLYGRCGYIKQCWRASESAPASEGDLPLLRAGGAPAAAGSCCRPLHLYSRALLFLHQAPLGWPLQAPTGSTGRPVLGCLESLVPRVLQAFCLAALLHLPKDRPQPAVCAPGLARPAATSARAAAQTRTPRGQGRSRPAASPSPLRGVSSMPF